jgi:hypothetical protein
MVAILRRASLAQTQTLRVAWAGVLLIAGLSAWLAVVGAGALLASGDLWGSIGTARGRTVGPALIVTSLLCSLQSNAGPQCGDQCSPAPTSSMRPISRCSG